MSVGICPLPQTPSPQSRLGHLGAADTPTTLPEEVSSGDLTRALQLEKANYSVKSKQLQSQLKDLKADMESLHLTEKLTAEDILHREYTEKGETKSITLERVSTGPILLYRELRTKRQRGG